MASLQNAASSPHRSQTIRSIGARFLLLFYPPWRAALVILFWPVMQRKRRETYQEFLHSPYWMTFREKAIKFHGGQCFVCDLDYKAKGKSIQVHHFKYKKWGISIVGREHAFWDVCLLCEGHHVRGEVSRWFLLWFRREYQHFRKVGKFSKGWKCIRFLSRWHLL